MWTGGDSLHPGDIYIGSFITIGNIWHHVTDVNFAIFFDR
jgi:hypothetical protein